MNIGQAAEATGLTAKAIRHYEALGLVVPQRLANDYRDYTSQDLEELGFLQRTRAVGFSLEEARQLLELYRNPRRQSATVKTLVNDKLIQLNEQSLILNQVRQTLTEMLQACAGDDSSECAIINQLADPTPITPLRFRLIE